MLKKKKMRGKKERKNVSEKREGVDPKTKRGSSLPSQTHVVLTSHF